MPRHRIGHMTLSSVRRALIAIPILIDVARPQVRSGLKFAVASVRPSDPASHHPRFEGTRAGRFTVADLSLRSIIQNAYDVSDLQLVGGPAWIANERYDINARPDDDGPYTGDQGRTMFRALLADRFRLVVYREMRERSEYPLVVAKDGPKVSAATPAGPGGVSGIRPGIGQRSVIKASIGLFASTLSGLLGRPVVDKTGLTGVYDFVLTFSPNETEASHADNVGEPRPATAAPGASIFTTLQEQLLKLESTKGSVEVLVIDSVERPSGN